MTKFDQTAFHQLINGDKVLYRELYVLYHDDWPKILNAIEAALAGGNAKEVELLTHRLKGLTRNFFAKTTAKLAGEMEEAARLGNLDTVKPRMAELRSRLAELDVALAQDLEQMK